MQIELWLTLLIGIFATGIITWYGTSRTIKAIHEDTMKLIHTIHEDIKAGQTKIETKLKEARE